MVDILVIKLSALGDFVQAIGSFQAIRAHHRPARLVLLTTGAYESFAEALGIFDEIWIDDRPKAWRLGKMRELGKRLNSRSWHFVYDLQTSRRSSGYFCYLRGQGPIGRALRADVPIPTPTTGGTSCTPSTARRSN